MALATYPTIIEMPVTSQQTAYSEPHWYAVYTCANHEKRVADQLFRRNAEYFLPLYESVRRWKDRRKVLHLPLFGGYLFVRLSLRNQIEILRVPGVVRLVGFKGSPTPIPDREIEALQNALILQLKTQPHPYLKVGQKVKIVRGPLQGTEGLLVRRKGAWRVILSIDLIMRAASVEVNAEDVEEISGR
jgi:transcription antitermination factor NusG